MEIIMMGDHDSGRTTIMEKIFKRSESNLIGDSGHMETYEFKIHKIEFKIYDFPTNYKLEESAPNEQMIIKNASALAYIVNHEKNTFESIEIFASIRNYIKKINTKNCQFFIFFHKADIGLETKEMRDEFMIKHKEKIEEEGIDVSQVNLVFTSIMDSSIFEAFSKIIQQTLPCSVYIYKLLNKLADFCKFEKVYVMDINSKLFIGHNDKTEINSLSYEIFYEMIDTHFDISLLYEYEEPEENLEKEEIKNVLNVQLNVDSEERKELFILKELGCNLFIAFLIRDINYIRPEIVTANIKKFKEGLTKLLQETSKTFG